MRLAIVGFVLALLFASARAGEGHRAALPLVVTQGEASETSTATATQTSTATPTQTATATQGLPSLTNGGFESGATGWSGDTEIIGQGPAHSGAQAAHYEGDASLTQTMVVSGRYLAYWVFVDSAAPCGPDRFEVHVVPIGAGAFTSDSFEICATGAGVWTKRRIDLEGYTLVEVHFLAGIFDPNSGVTLDDVSWEN